MEGEKGGVDAKDRTTHKQEAISSTTSYRSNIKVNGLPIHHARRMKNGIQKRTNWTERSIAKARAVDVKRNWSVTRPDIYFGETVEVGSQNSTGEGGPLMRYFLAKKRAARSPSAAKERSGRRMRPNHLLDEHQ
jgi:hypothetical protein